MKNIVFSLLIVCSLLLVSVPSVNAKMWTPGNPLVPCTNDCTICHLAQGIHNITKFIISIIAVTGTVIIVVAGIMYIVSSGNPQMTTLAKSAMTNALVGIVIILTAFLLITFIINTVFKANTTVDGMGSQMWTFKCN